MKGFVFFLAFLLGALTLPVSANANDLDENLVSYYLFDDDEEDFGDPFFTIPSSENFVVHQNLSDPESSFLEIKAFLPTGSGTEMLDQVITSGTEFPEEWTLFWRFRTGPPLVLGTTYLNGKFFDTETAELAVGTAQMDLSFEGWDETTRTWGEIYFNPRDPVNGTYIQPGDLETQNLVGSANDSFIAVSKDSDDFVEFWLDGVRHSRNKLPDFDLSVASDHRMSFMTVLSANWTSFGFWSRALHAEEIEDLWNEGEGLDLEDFGTPPDQTIEGDFKVDISGGLNVSGDFSTTTTTNVSTSPVVNVSVNIQNFEEESIYKNALKNGLWYFWNLRNLEEDQGRVDDVDFASSTNETDFFSFNNHAFVDGQLALQTQGSSVDFLETPVAFSPEKFTVNFWFRWENENSNQPDCIVADDDTYNFVIEKNGAFSIAQSTNERNDDCTTNFLDFIVGENHVLESSPSPLIDREWHMLSVTWDGEELEWFIDLNQRSLFPLPENFRISSQASKPLQLGRLTNGSFSNLGIWNRKLSEEELEDLWNSGTGFEFENFNNEPLGDPMESTWMREFFGQENKPDLDFWKIWFFRIIFAGFVFFIPGMVANWAGYQKNFILRSMVSTSLIAFALASSLFWIEFEVTFTGSSTFGLLAFIVSILSVWRILQVNRI